jgi:RNA polymerase sigma-70 factor, ECF subfamily
MSEPDRLRSLSFAIAYRMLGSVSEAEDVVQEALLRLHETEDVENPEALLTTITTRVAIDVLRSARLRRETYVGSWLPEPLVSEADAAAAVEIDETVSLAFLLALERLSPDERAVLVLREAFDYRFDEIGEIIGKDATNCRQILSRARRRVAEDRPRFDPDPAERDALAQRFLQAARDGDMDGLVALLAPDAVLVGDGGGKARAIPAPLVGAPQVARAIATFYRMGVDWGLEVQAVHVNGSPGLRSVTPDGRLVNIAGLDVEGGRIVRIHSIVNPDKLDHLGPVSDVALRPGAR